MPSKDVALCGVVSHVAGVVVRVEPKCRVVVAVEIGGTFRTVALFEIGPVDLNPSSRLVSIAVDPGTLDLFAVAILDGCVDVTPVPIKYMSKPDSIVGRRILPSRLTDAVSFRAFFGPITDHIRILQATGVCVLNVGDA